LPEAPGRRPRSYERGARLAPSAARRAAAADPVLRAGLAQVKARLEAWLRRLGAAGIVALGIFLAAGAFYVNAVVPAEQEAAAQRAALERLRSRTPYRPVSVDGRAKELRRFYLLFPPPTELNAHVERLHRLARGAGLDLAQGEYRLEKRTSGLWA